MNNMKRHSYSILISFFVSGLTLTVNAQSKQSEIPITSVPMHDSMKEAFRGKLLRSNLFEENKGQVSGDDADKVNYLYKSNGLTVFLLKTGIAYQFNKVVYNSNGVNSKVINILKENELGESEEAARLETYRMDVELVGANTSATLVTEGRSKDFVNYYNHNVFDVHSYTKITYQNVYPHIDWVIYPSDQGIKYDFVVRPGGKCSDIKLRTRHTEKLQHRSDGSLVLHNRMGTITEGRPISLQDGKIISTNFRLSGNDIVFELAPYDPDRVLIIDPALSWATYYGGNNNDYGRACAFDKSGNVYLAGYTYSSNNIANGGFNNTYSGGGLSDAFLAKFDSTGNRLWATYYGGEKGDQGYSCAVDTAGMVYLAGFTFSQTGIAHNGFQNTFSSYGRDGFLVKFNSSGNRLWGTYYGGNQDEYGWCCATDNHGNVYLSGYTESYNNISDGNGFQDTLSGNRDAYLVKFNSAGARLWSTYYGGYGQEEGKFCVTDKDNNVYLSGHTASDGIAYNGFQNTNSGGLDAFLVKFDSLGHRQWATFYGGNGYEDANACVVGKSGAVYIAGYTTSSNNIADNGFQDTAGGQGDAFLTKFDSSGNRLWATYYGGTGYEEGLSCAVNHYGDVFMAGRTNSVDNIANGGIQNIKGAHDDAFLVKFDDSGQRKWATYYGGNQIDRGYFCAVRELKSVYLVGQTGSVDNAVPGGFQNTYGGGVWDGFLVKIKDECPPATIIPAVDISVNPIGELTPGQSITFTASINNGGPYPQIGWYRNNNPIPFAIGLSCTGVVGIDFMNNDQIKARLVSSAECLQYDTAWSNGINIAIDPLSTSSPFPPDGFHIFPNPSRGNVYIEGCHKGDQLEIVNVMGQIIESKVFNSDRTLLDLTSLNSGLYLFRFNRNAAITWTVKLIKH